jgi:hypothetical protein
MATFIPVVVVKINLVTWLPIRATLFGIARPEMNFQAIKQHRINPASPINTAQFYIPANSSPGGHRRERYLSIVRIIC